MAESANASTGTVLGPRIEIVVRGGPARATPDTELAAGAARAGAASARENDALRSEILDLHARLRELPLWDLLGVARDAKPTEVRRAYLRAAKRLHPDRIGQLGLVDLKEAANEVFAEIARAHEVLSDPAQREHYEATLGDAAARRRGARRRGGGLLSYAATT